MASISTGNLRKQEILIEKYISGERNSEILCVTNKIAKILNKKYPEVTLIKRESINEKLGLCIFVIKKKIA